MPPSIFRTLDFSNQFPFPLEVRKIGIPLYFETKTCPFWLTVYITNDKIYTLMYALFIVFKWLYIGKQSTVFSTETSQIEPGIHFCLWQGIILRCISTFMWNWNSTFCTPGVRRTLIMYSQTGLANEFDLSLICLMAFPHQLSLPATINCLPCTILQCTTYTKLSHRKRLNS